MKRNMTIGCLGHSGHGKTSLMVAMAARARARSMKVQWPCDYGMQPDLKNMIENSERKNSEDNRKDK
jgi:ABC-type phosphonate transport system ATPase subunit